MEIQVIPYRIIHLQTRFLHSGLQWLRSGTIPRCTCGRKQKVIHMACIRNKLSLPASLPRQLLMIPACWPKTCHGGPSSTHFSLKYSRSRRSASAAITCRKSQFLTRQDPWRERGSGKKVRESFENPRNTTLGMTRQGPNNLMY